MSFNGYDFFTFLPDTKEEVKCKVCGQICEVKRGVESATSFGEAMVHRTHIHDTFSCPDRYESWHKQALKLVIKIKKDPSPSIIKMMEKDLKKIIKDNDRRKKYGIDNRTNT